jgi:hypothetical protein
MIIKQLLIAIFASAMISPAQSQEARKYVEYCRASNETPDMEVTSSAVSMYIGFCLGLMDGVRGANFYLRKANSEAAFCEPASLKNDDLAKVFVATMDKNPHLGELRGSLAVLVALRSAFPCKSAK